MIPKMQLCHLARLTAVCGVAVLAGCSGGGSTDGVAGTSGDFLVLNTNPPNNGRLFLNEPLLLNMSNDVDLSTADLNTVTFQVFDLNGTPVNERPAGVFSLGRSPGDDADGRQLVFSPRFPDNNTYDNGGFRPGRLYVVQLVSGDGDNGTVLRDANGQGLGQPVTFQFRTADGTSPAELFSDTRSGGPRVLRSSIGPSDDQNQVFLARASQEPVEIRLEFDQPVNPADSNVPVSVSPDPLARGLDDRGRIFLEYDDPAARNTWIPATVDLEVNSREGSTVVLRPIGVLPNNAEVRVIVDSTFEDMSGESNASDASYQRIVRTFRTVPALEPLYDAYIDNFDEDSAFDPDAPFLEPSAALTNGRLSATFAFDGQDSRRSYRPQDRQVILNTDFTQLTTTDGFTANVSGGVFEFQDVEIPNNVEVQGAGTNPMIWLVDGTFTVNGTLSVDGGDGERVNSLNSPNTPTGGGIGVCGGGNGGRGSPQALDRSPIGEDGFGPGQLPEGGGNAGEISCTTTCNRGAGGGGGSFATEGDPFYPPAGTPLWEQLTGAGGPGCINGSIPGGRPGPSAFTDTRPDNDFWGTGVNVFRQIRIRGELIAPQGGSGGGGGGDRSQSCRVPDPNGYLQDNKGGGGGGGAGILIVQALGPIVIGPDGRVSADGGHGGGGEQAGGNNQGGGGGAGSGGMVVLISGTGIEIDAHSSTNNPLTQATYGELDYKFAITADGGVGTQGRFGGLEIREKYNPVGDSRWDDKPAGGFGGFGLVQLLTPPGDDADGTGNRLDDNIQFFYDDPAQGGRVPVPTARKVELLAWRGWSDQDGVSRDDNGNVIDLGNNDGDIRPSPILLPSSIAPVSRARSRWVDLGSVVRERIDPGAPSDDPRVVRALAGEEPRPDFGDPVLGYAGTTSDPMNAGYASFDTAGRLDFPVVMLDMEDTFAAQSLDADSSFEGAAAYEVTVSDTSPVRSVEEGRYTAYQARLLDSGGAVVGELRILGHSDRSVWLEPAATLPTGVVSFQIVAKFFSISVAGNDGLGDATFQLPNGDLAPEVNVRVGFAFSTDPAAGPGASRWPSGTDPNAPLFEFDLLNPDFLMWLETNRPQFVQWDVLFNTRYHPALPNNDRGGLLEPDVRQRLPVLDDLVLPYRF